MFIVLMLKWDKYDFISSYNTYSNPLLSRPPDKPSPLLTTNFFFCTE